jgi:hypothetical protein
MDRTWNRVGGQLADPKLTLQRFELLPSRLGAHLVKQRAGGKNQALETRVPIGIQEEVDPRAPAREGDRFEGIPTWFKVSCHA